MRRHAAVVSAVCAVAFSFAVPLFAQAPAAVSAKIWTDRAPEIEAYLKSAEVVGMEELKVGVTRPRRAKLAPGGPSRRSPGSPLSRADILAIGRVTSRTSRPTSWTSCSASG